MQVSASSKFSYTVGIMIGRLDALRWCQ